MKADADSKLILDYRVTPANIHDSRIFTDFIDENDKAIYADSAYTGKELSEHITNEVC